MKKIRPFSGISVYQICTDKTRKFTQEIRETKEDYILKVDIDTYANYLAKEHALDVPSLHRDQVSIDHFDRQVPQSIGSSITVLVYHIPFSGDGNLWSVRPQFSRMWDILIEVDEQSISFEINTYLQTKEMIERRIDENVRDLERDLENLRIDLKDYNSGLKLAIVRLIQARKDELIKKYDLISSLNIPVKRRDNLPQSFSVPSPSARKKVDLRPEVSSTPKLNPTLAQEIYRDILQTIYDLGRSIEQLPSTYSGKDEESLRDHFLLILGSRFTGGTSTGETFNKNGKTDILIKADTSNVFIAECKFWKGEKLYLDTITQLLSYLTWRDSKAALVIFVQNKKISSVLTTMSNATPKHPNYIRQVDVRDDSWFEYVFHLDGDSQRHIQLAVLAFHFPTGIEDTGE